MRATPLSSAESQSRRADDAVLGCPDDWRIYGNGLLDWYTSTKARWHSDSNNSKQRFVLQRMVLWFDPKKMSAPQSSLVTPVQVNRFQLPSGEWFVQVIVQSGILQTSVTLDPNSARMLAKGLTQQADLCDKSISLISGSLPRTAGN